MTSSIFRKLVVVFLTVTLLSLFGLSLLITYLLEEKLTVEKEQQLRQQSEKIVAMVTKFDQERLSFSELKRELKKMELQYYVTITWNGPGKMKRSEMTDEFREWATKVTGESTTIFIGKLTVNATTTAMVAGSALQLKRLNVKSMFVFSQMTDVEALKRSINGTVYTSFLLIGLITGIFVFFVSKRMVSTIHEMTDIASEMMAGRFHRRLPVRGNDELDRLALAINRLAGSLQQIEQHRSRFVSDLAHELRTPLTAIMTTIRGVTDGTLSGDEGRECLQIAMEEAKRMRSLIGDVLELSRFEEQAITMQRKTTDVSLLAKQVAQLFVLQASQGQISLQVRVAPDVIFDTDENLIKQVLMNLLSNAITHNPPGTTVTLELGDHDKFAIVTVADDGQGIDAEHIPYLFDRFYKVDSSRRGEGSGLGLTISKRMIELLGGSIGVESSERGTIFTVQLPK